MNKQAFIDLGLSDEIITALEKKGFDEPSQIQKETIPLMLAEDKDIIGQAQTGTGKTAAFGLPIIEKLSPSKAPVQALVLTPTRELTIQVSEELYTYKGKKPMTITPIYGGQSIEKQRKQLNRPNDIVVGTPGRLIDHLRSKKLDLSQLKYLVLDEADEMLNSGFIEDIDFILSKSNPDRTILLFSATMPPQILNLAKKYMNDYTTVKVKKQTLSNPLTDQIYFEVRESDKGEALCRIIDQEADFYGLIFCRTKLDVERVKDRLIKRGYFAEAMHGDLSQAQRERVLSKFKKRQYKIMVVTDVASRGLDINDLSHVINYALPQDPESYVHRIGRTGRAGKSGTAITFITPSEYRKLVYIQKVSKMDIKKGAVPTVKEVVETKRIRLKETFHKVIEGTVQNEYIDFAEDLLATYSPKEALAGVLKVAYETELSEKSYSDLNVIAKDGGSRGRKDRSDRRSRGKRDRRDGGNFIDSKGQARLFVAKGKSDGLSPKKVIQLLEKKSRVPSHRIQGLEMYDSYSFVNVSFNDAEAILGAFKSSDKRSIVERAK